MKVPMWPGSNELPFNGEIYERNLSDEAKARGAASEAVMSSHMQCAIEQTLWLMKIRGVEPVWIEI